MYNEVKETVTSRGEFQKKIREEFIPFLNETGLNSHIKYFQADGMFNKWTEYFYWDDGAVKIVELKEVKI